MICYSVLLAFTNQTHFHLVVGVYYITVSFQLTTSDGLDSILKGCFLSLLYLDISKILTQ